MVSCTQPFYFFDDDPENEKNNSFLIFITKVDESYTKIHPPIANTISVFNLISNILIMIILTKKEMRSIGVNVLMMFMSLLDLIVTLMKIADTFTELAYDYFTYPVVIFLFWFQYFNLLFGATSFFISVIMAFCRAMVLMKPHGNNEKWQSPRMAVYLASATFCTVAILNIPVIFCFTIVDAEEAPGYYLMDISEYFFGYDCFLYRYTFWLVGFGYRLIPSLMLLIFSIIIVCKMRENLKNGRNSSRKLVHRTSRLVTAVVTMSLITGLPIGAVYTFAAIFIQDYATYINTKFSLFANLFGLINCAITFPIYTMFSSQFRKLFIEMFIPKYFWKSKDSASTSIFSQRSKSTIVTM